MGVTVQLHNLKGLIKLLHLLSAADLPLYQTLSACAVSDAVSLCCVVCLRHAGHLSGESLAAQSKTCMHTGSLCA